MTYLAWAAILATAAYSQGIENCPPGAETVINCPSRYFPKPNTKPSAADRQALTAKIQAIQGLRTPYETAKIRYEAADQAVQKLRDERPIQDQALPGEASALQEFTEAAEDYRRKKKELYEASNEVIQETVRVYGLTPPQTDFSKDQKLGERHRTTPAWALRFSELETRDEKRRGSYRLLKPQEEKEIRDKYLRLGITSNPPAGRLTGDGRLAIFRYAMDSRDAFAADRLAVVIYHETIHWVKRVGRGRSTHTPSERYDDEELAYRTDAAFAQALGLDPGPRMKIANRYKTQSLLAQGKGWDWVILNHSQDWIDASPSDANALNDFSGDPGDLEAYKIAAEVAFDREMSYPTAPKAISPTSAANKAFYAADPMGTQAYAPNLTDHVSRDFEVMRKFVLDGCMSPASITDGRIAEFGAAWKDWQEMGKQTPSVKAKDPFENLFGCPHRFLTALLGASPSGVPGSAADRDWIAQTAYNSQDRAPIYTAPRPKGDAPENHDVSGEGKARDQARRINGSKWKN